MCVDTPAFTSHWLWGQQQGQKGQKERHSRLPGNFNWPREPYHLPLYPNSLLNKISLVEPPPLLSHSREVEWPIQQLDQICVDVQVPAPRDQKYTTVEENKTSRLQSLPFKDSLIFDQWPTEDMFASCVTFRSNRCPSKTGGRLELLHMATATP